MTLSDVLNGIPTEGLALNTPVTLVTADSREVKPGAIYVAIKGSAIDGHRFLHEAHRKGAVLLVGEEAAPNDIPVPYLRTSHARKTLAHLAANFHRNPSHSMLMVGVTGTSGKTTTTYLIESILKDAGLEPGLIGTVNHRYKNKVVPSNNTTPGPVELQSLLAEMRDAGCKSVVMEVSSHGLKMHRTAQIAFDAAVFTNLTPEHLDFHPDMEDYFHAKGILFKEMADEAREIGKKPVAIINGEDEYGKRLIRELKQEFLDFSQDAHQLKVDLSGIHGKAHGIEIQSKLTGRFNAFNIAAAVAAAKALQIDAKIISRGIGNLPVVPGRLERVPNTKGIHVLVDYAHKPDALEKVLKTLKDVKGSHRLITVFGCGGDRDRKKRPVMGKIAVELSDHVVITSDNPRTEDPGTIIQEILGGTAGYKNFEVEADRKSAIFAAIQVAKAGDLVVIAGKGHEDYQILGTGKIHFDDREVAAEALKSG